MTQSPAQVPEGALEGIRVLDVTRFLAGPYAAMMLAELGAEVIKLEDPDRPDEARSVGPYFQKESSLYFTALNSGKRSVAVRYSSAAGQQVIRDLAATCDIVLDNNKPGVMEKFGIGSDTLREANPELITCSLSGYGSTGPDRARAGYDYTIQAHGGVMSLTGEPGAPPGKAGISYIDHSGGITAALAVCAALVQRGRTGIGRHVDVALFDIQISMLSYLAAWHLNADFEGARTEQAGHPSLVPAQNFGTSDGHVAIFVGNDAMWSRMATALADPGLLSDTFRTSGGRLANKERLVNRIAELLASITTRDLVALLEAANVPCSPVNSLAEALAEPQVRARSLIITAAHPSYGEHHRVAGPLTDMRVAQMRPAPLLGENTLDVLREAGFSDSHLDALLADGTVHQQVEELAP